VAPVGDCDHPAFLPPADLDGCDTQRIGSPDYHHSLLHTELPVVKKGRPGRGKSPDDAGGADEGHIFRNWMQIDGRNGQVIGASPGMGSTHPASGRDNPVAV
jgi:hypothetical protein